MVTGLVAGNLLYVTNMGFSIIAAFVLGGLYALILGVGVYGACKHRRKNKEDGNNSQLLMVANRDIGVVLGTMTLTATWIGGAFINGTAEAVYDPNIGFIWSFTFTFFISLLLKGRFMAGLMRDAQYTTLLDPIEYKLGHIMVVLCFIPTILAEITYAAAILSALGTTISVILDFDLTLAIIISASIATTYTLIGGLYSVAYTDVVQLGCMVLGLYLALPFAMLNPAVDNVFSTFLPAGNSTGWVGRIEFESTFVWLDMFFMLILGEIPYQEYFQRVFASKSAKIGAQITYLSMIGMAICLAPAVMIGAVATATDWNQTSYGLPTPAERNASYCILPIVFHHLTPTPVSIIGLASISAAVMSSTDSSCLASSTLYTRNLHKAIFRKQASDAELVWSVRIFILCFGILSFVVSLRSTTVFGLALMSLDIGYVLVLPQFLSVLFLDVNTYGAILGYFTGVILRFGAGIDIFNLDAFIQYPGGELFPFRTFSMLTSFFVYVTVSYITKYLFESKILDKKYDVLKCNLANGGRTRFRRSSNDQNIDDTPQKL